MRLRRACSVQANDFGVVFDWYLAMRVCITRSAATPAVHSSARNSIIHVVLDCPGVQMQGVHATLDIAFVANEVAGRDGAVERLTRIAMRSKLNPLAPEAG